MSISHAIALAESLRRRIDCASLDATNTAVSPEEIAAGKLGRQKAKSVLASSITAVDNALAVVRGMARESAQSEPNKWGTTNDIQARPKKTTTMSSFRRARTMTRATNSDAALDAVRNALSADGLQAGSVNNLTKMACAIEPVIDKFDEVLKEPNLDTISATLNTVPVVGLKGRSIMYINTSSSASGEAALDYDWAFFSSLPSEATPAANDAIHFFPFNGDFYLSVGKDVWKKAHITPQDARMNQAVDNWPALYVKDWTVVGVNILPAADLVSVIPFAVLNSVRATIAFKLVMLATDGSFKYFDTDTLTPNAEIRTLSYAVPVDRDGPSESPKFVKAAYWDDLIVAVDDQSNLWDIRVDWDHDTYTVSHKTVIDPSIEFTANDTGPVALRSDGFLWQRFVEPASSGSDDPTLQWKRWIAAGGVTNLGVASPGVVFDMNILTHALRGRYLDVQTSVYPIVGKIQSFASAHDSFLNLSTEKIDEWQNADDEEKKKLAKEAAANFLAHAKGWSWLVSQAVDGVKEEVNIMAVQLRDIHSQLDKQLSNLHDVLGQLNKQLDAENEQLSELKAQFWASVLGALIGLILLIASIVLPIPAVMFSGGSLFAAGLSGAIALRQRISELSGKIEQTGQQIRDVSSAICVLSCITPLFTNLDTLYGDLNVFWGDMADAAANIGDMDETAMELLADDMYDPSTIAAGKRCTQDLLTATETYLNVLHRQGVKIPQASALVSLAPEHPADVVNAAHHALITRDTDGYKALMLRATLAQYHARATAFEASLTTGLWFDVPALRTSASIWMHDSRSVSRAVIPSSILQVDDSATRAIVAVVEDLDDSLDEVRPLVVQMLGGVISLGDTMVGWVKQYPTAPIDPKGIAAVERLRAQARDACKQAQGMARSANNSFADFNHEAQDYQLGLDRKIRGTTDDEHVLLAEEQAKLDLIRCSLEPCYTLACANIWGEYQPQLLQLEGQVIQYWLMQQSGVIFQGKALTWADMVKAVSGDLGEVYDTLDNIDGLLMENPIAYAKFMGIDWQQILDDARDVLIMLQCGVQPSTIATSATAVALHKSTVLAALSPPPNLTFAIEAHSAELQTLSSKLVELLHCEGLKDFIVYWENTRHITLLDIACGIQREHRKAKKAQHRAIQDIYAFAGLQEAFARDVVEGRLTIASFVETARTGLVGLVSSAAKVERTSKSVATRLDFVATAVTRSVAEVTRRIDALSSGDMEKVIPAVSAAVSSVFTPSEPLTQIGVPRSVIAALSAASRRGASFFGTSATVELVLTSSEPDVTRKTIAALKTLKETFATKSAQLKTLQRFVARTVTAAGEFASVVSSMHQVADVAGSYVIKGSLVSEDAVSVQDEWAEISRSTSKYFV